MYRYNIEYGENFNPKFSYKLCRCKHGAIQVFQVCVFLDRVCSNIPPSINIIITQTLDFNVKKRHASIITRLILRLAADEQGYVALR